MRKLTAVILLGMIVSFVCVTGSAESAVKAYDEAIRQGGVWTRIDYNVTYEKRAKDYLPDCFTYSKTSFTSDDIQVFGDDTGEVWCIISSEVYRLWMTEEGYLVLTSTSEGFGWTGYALFKPSK